MSTLPLFDYLFSREEPATGSSGRSDIARRAGEMATHLVEEAITEHVHIREVDDELGARNGIKHFDRQAATMLEGAYEAWADRADAVLRRVHRLRERGVSVARAEELRNQVAGVRALLMVSLSQLDVAAEQLRQGQGIPIEEVRRGIHARVRA